ncbi:MAG: hypothetical protein PHP57_02640 [Sideroxydans sp.]|nr:hypothetical protein [Sideroxydans sp.]
MRIAYLILPRAIRWNIRPDDPVEFPAIPKLQVTVLNPLALEIHKVGELTTFPLRDGCIHTITNTIHFRVPDELNISGDSFPAFQNWLRLLRLVSRQAMLPTDIVGVASSNIEGKLSVNIPKAAFSYTIMGTYRIETAVNTSVLLRASQINSDSEIPICHEILLDALAAFERNDYRQTVLYSAIAVESLARTYLDTAYEVAITSPHPPMHLNILEFPQAGGIVQKKDPIFSLLYDNDNFQRLLHESPLYLTRRSLLAENENLYRRAINLYRTRNRLGHGHMIPENSENLLSIDSVGALSGLETAISVFEWFGETGYRLPRFDAYEVKKN